MRKIWVISFLVIISSCKIIRPSSDGGASAYATYQEDLSGSLPQYPDFRSVIEDVTTPGSPSAVQAVDTQLDLVQKRLAEKNKSEPYFSGYTVLVFSGIDRDRAFKTQDNLKLFYPELVPEMQYQQPRYLVKIGQFTYKIEAQKIFSQLKEQFPTARIIQDRFQRKEYAAPTSDPNAPNQN